MRAFLVALAIVALAAAPVYAEIISVDGSMDDWGTAHAVCYEPIVYHGSNTYQILSYGARIESSTLYAFVQTNVPVPLPSGSPSGSFYPGVYIDVDNNSSTTVGNSSPFYSWFPQGTDIVAECEYDNVDLAYGGGGPGGGTVNFWGHGNDVTNGWAASTGTFAHSADQTIFEWSVPVSEIIAEVANCDGATPAAITGPNSWRMWIGEAVGTGDHNFGLVPEPGALAMLIGASLALLGYALRRRL